VIANRKTARILSFLFVIHTVAGCAREPTIEIREGIDVCRECNMIIDQANQACGYVSGSEFITFDSPGCLLRYYESLPKDDRPQTADIFFADYRDGSFHSAERTTFLLTSHVRTVMNAQVICFGNPEAAMETRDHPDEVVTDWYGYRTERGTPDIVLEVVFGPEGMEPDVVQVGKDDLVLLRAIGQDLPDDLTLSIRGYPEAGPITIPASGQSVEFRLLATRPGAGFPVILAGGDPVGMIKVAGAHTLDEAAK
jgi:hypothetical protein